MGGGYEYFETEDKGGSLTIAACVSNGASRHAMPTIPELVYAALLYHDESPENENFEPGTQTNGEDDNVKLIFSFQRPEDTRGTFTLEVFAFIKSDIVTEDGTTNFSRNGALLSGKKDGCAIEGDTINVSEPIELSSSEQGTVSLKIKVPDDCTLEIDDTTSDGESRFNVTGTSPDFIVTQKDASGISTSAYQVKFIVKKGDEIIHIFSEYINVFNGLCTDTWDGLAKGAAKEITQSMISSTVYVRGMGGWYETSPYKDTATANDDNLGSFLSPLATIQKAIDKIIAINDGSSAYTIYVDGTLTATDTTYIGTNGMADFSALDENLTLTIKPLSGTATLDGGAVFNADGTVETAGIDKSIIYARPGTNGNLNLTLEKLVITGGSNGGVTVLKCTLTMKGCEINRCTCIGSGGGVNVNGGTFTMEDGTISGNSTKGGSGGGVCVSAGTFIMKDGIISSNTAIANGGGVYMTNSTFKMEGGEIKENKASLLGGGIYVYSGTFKMEGGSISECTAKNHGGGVYIKSGGKFEMSGMAKITGCKTTSTGSTSKGAGIYNNGTLTITGGTISGSNATFGGGVYVTSTDSTFTMAGGTISDCTATQSGGGVCIDSSARFEMSGTAKITKCKMTSAASSTGGGGIYNAGTLAITGGTISGCTSAINGGGIYVREGTFTMEDGTISGNSATYEGSGVFLYSSCMLNMSGNAKIESDNDVKLYNDSKICITDTLTASSPVATITPSSYTARTQVLSVGNGVTLNGSICNKFAVTSQSDGTEWRVALDGADGVLIRKYALRDTGPGDGAVCYYDPDGFTVNGKTCHYLECSKEQIGYTQWCSCLSSSGYCEPTLSNEIGTGYANTQAILNHPNHASATASNCAAKACAEYKTDTTTAGEWFLPSNNETAIINKGVTITSNEKLWMSAASRDGDNSKARYGRISSNGFSSDDSQRNILHYFRAMRAF